MRIRLWARTFETYLKYMCVHIAENDVGNGAEGALKLTINNMHILEDKLRTNFVFIQSSSYFELAYIFCTS